MKPRFRDIKKKEKLKKEEITTLPYASLGDKTKAFITDSFMLLMPFMYATFYLFFGGREEFAKDMLLGWGLIFIPFLIIETLFFYYKGQTPGFKAYEIKLIDEKTQTTPSFFKILVKNILSILLFFTFLWIFIDRKSVV